MSDLLDYESPELDAAAYLRALAAEFDGVDMLPTPRGNRLRRVADALDRYGSFSQHLEGVVADLHLKVCGGG